MVNLSHWRWPSIYYEKPKRMFPTRAWVYFTLIVEKTLGWCFQLDVVIQGADFIALSIHWVKNYYGCIFCKGWIILWPSVRLGAKEAEAMMKIIKSCASGHKAIKCRWRERNFAFLLDPLTSFYHPLLPPEPDVLTTGREDGATASFTNCPVSWRLSSQTGSSPSSQRMRLCQAQAVFLWLPSSSNWLCEDFQ